MDLNDLYRRTVEEWRARVSGVGDDDWTRATPCSEWDVRALVNHVVGEDLWSEPLVAGATIEEVGDRFAGDLLGDDPLAVADSAAAASAAAVEERLPQGGTVQLSFGEAPVEEYVHQLAADHLVHAWDLAAATGQDRTLDEESVAAVATWFADRAELYREAGVIGAPGQGGDDPQSQLIAAFGRDPETQLHG